MSVPVGRGAALAQRTQVIDAEVARAIGRGTKQIVLLGAGADGRALRFGGGPTRWFEVDRPDTQSATHDRLGALGIATPATTYLGLDLRHDELGVALQAAGHDAAAPSLFVAETVFDTLTLEATASICDMLRDRATLTGSVLVATFSVAPEASGVTGVFRAATGLLGRATTDEPRRSDLRPGDPEKLMVVTGWRVTHAESSSQRRLDPGAHTVILVSEPGPVPA